MIENSRYTKAIAALLTSPSIRQASKISRISEETIYRWLRDDTFQELYQAAKRDCVQQATSYLRNLLGRAVATLETVMDDPESNPGVRVSAASKIIDLALRAVEIEELESRLTALENQNEKL